jgi:Zn-dependent protease
MMRSVTLGRIWGIDIRVHPSFALVLVWAAFQWGLSGDGTFAALLYGLILVGFVFLCVLLHELGHCLMAMQYGVRVHDITLLPIGGVARLENATLRPGHEALIAFAGPLVNIAILVALFPLMLLLGVLTGNNSMIDYLNYLDDVAPGGLLVYLFFPNVTLFAFNLLPAFPMDGGRVLRAGHSKVTTREQATNFAVALGQVLAVLMGIIGVFVLHSYLLPLVSIFIIVAAYAEGRAVKLESAMRRLRVGQFALWDMGGISAHHPLTYALRGGPRDVVVTENNLVIGMLWRHQLLPGLNGGAAGKTVADVMDSNVVTVDVDDSVYDVQQRMHDLNRWAMPVTEAGQYRGIFTADRFVHVYRYLNAQSVGNRTASSVFTSLGKSLRAWVR